MARKKDPVKPLFGLKHDFYDSLDNALQQAINLMQAVDQVADLDQVKPGPAIKLLRARSKAMREALMSDD